MKNPIDRIADGEHPLLNPETVAALSGLSLDALRVRLSEGELPQYYRDAILDCLERNGLTVDMRAIPNA